MPEPFTIQGFASKGSKPNPHGGVLHKWEVSLDDEKGETHHGVYWQSKSDELHIGQEVYGEISDGDYGPRFRTAQREDGAPRPSQSVSGGRRDDSETPPEGWMPTSWTQASYGGYRWEPPERGRRIERQHSQEMAIRWIVSQGLTDIKLEDIRWIIGWFQDDLDLDADVGGVVTGGSAPSAAGVSADKQRADEDYAKIQEASTVQKRRLTQEFNRLQLAKDAQKAIVLYRCHSEKATKDGASQLIKDITEGATAESLLAEISDGRRAGNPLAARAAALIPTDVPNAEPEPEIVEPNGESQVPF